MTKPTVISAAHYGETVAALRQDPIVKAMTLGCLRVPRDTMVHPSGSVRHEFLSNCNARYRELGGAYAGPKHLGAVAEAVISLLDTPQTPVEQWAYLDTKTLQGVLKNLRTGIASGKLDADMVEASQDAIRTTTEALAARGV